MACRISARNASVVHEIPLLSAVGFDSLPIPLAPSAASPLGVLIPLAPPAGIAALSPPLRPGGTKPPIVLRPAEVGGRGGYSSPAGSMSMSAGLHSAKQSSSHSAAPGAPGRVRRGVPAAVVRAAVHACDVAPPERVILHVRSAVHR